MKVSFTEKTTSLRIRSLSVESPAQYYLMLPGPCVTFFFHLWFYPEVSITNTTNNTPMAKIKHNNFMDTVDEVISDAKKMGIVHLYTEDEELTGRRVKIKGKDLFHFGTTGYLGLEQDVRLKTAAVDAIWKYGTQFPL